MRGLFPVMAVIFAIMLLFWLTIVLALPRGADDGPTERVIFTDLATHYDASGTLTAEQIVTAEFEPATQYCAHGNVPGQLWYRFYAANVGEEMADEALLWIRVPNLDLITLNYQDAAGNWQQMVTGDTFALHDRPLKSSKLGFQLDMSEIEGRPVYLGIQSSGTLAVALEIGALSDMQDRQVVHNLRSVVFFTIILICLVIIAILYLQTRASIFLFFVLSQLTYIVGAFSYTGFLSLLFPTLVTDAITTQWILIAVFASAAFQLALFKTLGVRQWALKIMTVFVIALAVVPIGYLFFDARIILTTIWHIGFLFAIFIVIAAWNLSDETYITKRAMRIIYSIYSVSIFIWLLPSLGWLPATKLGFYGEIIRGVVNMSLVLTILFWIAKAEERKKAQVLGQVKKLEEEATIQNHLSQMYRDILWTISHEFGNGLSVFRFALSKPEITAQNKARMERALTGLEDLLGKFKHSEQVELGAISVQDTKINLAALVKQEAKTATNEAPLVRIRFLAEKDLPIVADEVCLRLIISNLLSNAVKYAEPNTTVDVTFADMGDQVAVSVENICPVAALPDTARVFDRFYRDPHVLEKAGSGLGLYIVQQLLKLMEGGCRFEIVHENKVRVTAWMPKQR